MHAHAFILSSRDTLPLLDEEFDKADMAPAPVALCVVGHGPAGDDLAWDDQLDNGEEMSL